LTRPELAKRQVEIGLLSGAVKPSVGSLAQLFLLVLRYIDLTIRIAALDAVSNRTLAPGVYTRIDVTNSSSRSCLRHESAVQSNEECQGEKR
jgi:hypothetical protein